MSTDTNTKPGFPAVGHGEQLYTPHRGNSFSGLEDATLRRDKTHVHKFTSVPKKTSGDDSACESHLSRIKSIKREETRSNKPDPDTSSWLETFLITNSWLWVTRVAARHEGSTITVLASSQRPIRKHPGQLCKSNSRVYPGSDPCQKPSTPSSTL